MVTNPASMINGAQMKGKMPPTTTSAESEVTNDAADMELPKMRPAVKVAFQGARPAL